MLHNVLDFPTPEDAINAARDGDRVYFPAAYGPYTAPASGYRIRRNIEIFGDGAASPGVPNGTTFYPGGPVPVPPAIGSDVFFLDPYTGIELENVYFHDFKITKRPGATGLDGGNGITCRTTPGHKKSKIRIARVVVLNMAANGICFEGADNGDNAILHVHLDSSFASFCGKNGLLLKNVTQADLLGCSFISNELSGIYAEQCGITLLATGVENNCSAVVSGMDLYANLSLVSCHVASVIGCHFEKLHLGANRNGVLVHACGGSAQINGCLFQGFFNEQAQQPEEATGIVVKEGQANGPVVIGTNRFANIPTLMFVGDVPDLVVLPQFNQDEVFTMSLPAAQKGLVGFPHVNRGIAGPDANVLSGLAVPAATTLPTGNLRDGMLAYDSTANGLRLRKSSTWIKVNEPAVYSNPQRVVSASIQSEDFDTGLDLDKHQTGFVSVTNPNAQVIAVVNDIVIRVTNPLYSGEDYVLAAGAVKIQYLQNP